MLRGIGFALCLVAAVSPVAAASLPEAAMQGSGAAVRSLLGGGVEPDSAGPDGMTALHWAARNGDLGMVEDLLAAGAAADVPSRYGVTPMSLACTSRSGPIVRLLLARGADPNRALRGGETPLMTAARAGALEAVEALIASGADVNQREETSGQTALMWASAEGHAGVALALIKAGADVDARLATGFSPLLFAAREGRLDVLPVLLRAGADPNDTIRPPPVMPSKARGYRGAPPFGASALLIAVENAHFEFAVALLDAGADPNAAVPGYTPLHALARVRNPGVGDNDPPPDGSGSVTSLEFVREMVARGADLEARMPRHINLGNTRLNKRGATPFFLAAQSADADLMRIYAEVGADVKATNADGSTALMAAAGLGTRSPGEDAGTEDEVLEAVELALDLGHDINAVDDNGETAMHGAAYKNLPGVVEFLAEKGADISIWNRSNKFGWTPLAIATGYRFGNFKPSDVTVAAIKRVMLAAGIPPPEKVLATTKQIY